LLPDEVILSVPLETALMEASDGEGLEDPHLAMWPELPWSVRMAIRILRGLESSGVAGGGGDAETWRRPWLEQLPSVETPPFSFTAAQLHQIEDHATMQEALVMRQMADECFPMIEAHLAQLGHDVEAFMWALSVCHSRCFRFEQGGVQHIMVPGVDMANHTWEANAAVRLCVEPSQGLQAAAEVGEVDAQTRQYFQLCAGEDGIEEGKEVTISYGSWPNDVFLLFFGFCPDANTNDSVVLFQDHEELVAYFLSVCVSDSDAVSPELIQAQTCMLDASLGRTRSRLAIMSTGIDADLQKALQIMYNQELPEGARPPEPAELLLQRCSQLLEGYTTTGGGTADPLIARYIEGKQHVLRNAVAAMG